MDESYDAIVLGTGLTECIMSGLLSCEGKKVLHIDSNEYYGGDCASLNLTQLFSKFRDGAEAPKAYGRDRDYYIDLVPKLMMADGSFVKMLVSTDVTKYLELRQIAGSFVFKSGKINKVPSTENEALMSSLIGILEKKAAYRFFKWVGEYGSSIGDVTVSARNNDSAKGGAAGEPVILAGVGDPRVVPMSKVFEHFGLDKNTQEFIGHAMALYLDDSYLAQPAHETLRRIMLYKQSLARFGSSPYVYPAYGLGELPQAFARCAAVHGGTFMLARPIDKIIYEDEESNKKGRFKGIESQGERAYAPLVIASPAYFKDRVRVRQRVVRSICLLDHPVQGTSNAHSLQLILPRSQVPSASGKSPRNSDIYVAVVSDYQNVCAKGYYVAIASTTVETDDPEKELEPAHALLRPIVDKFVAVADVYEPTDADAQEVSEDGVLITRSYDATSHFETVSDDVFRLYKRATGRDLVLRDGPPELANANANAQEQQQQQQQQQQ